MLKAVHEVEDMDGRVDARVRGGSLAMPKRGNQDVGDDRTPTLYQLCTHAKLLQLCPSLCNPMDCSPPGSSVHEIL